MVYAATDAASKVKAERAAWEYYDQAKPNYSFNVVLPDLVLGPVSNPAPGHYSTASWLTELYNGNSSGQIVAFLNPPARIVDVRDVAIIHVAALLDESVNKERLWAAAHTVHVDEILDIWKEAYPEKKGVLPGKIGLPQPPKQVIDTSRSDELLQKFEGRSWIDKKTTLVENVRA